MIKYTYDARGQMVAVYEDGTVVPVLGAEQDAGMAQGSSGTGTTTQESGESANGGSGGSGYARNSGYSRNYSPRQPNFGSDYPTTPAYADGSRHPLQGGNPRTPGGLFAQQSAESGGYGGQQQVSVPGGAAAGPFETRAANPARGGGSYSGGSGGSGGGGGGPSAVYSAWKAKLEGKLMPGSSSYSSSSYDSYKEPKVKKQPMRGPYAKGLEAEQAVGLSFRPTALIDKAVPGLGDASPFYDTLSSLPAGQLAMLSKRNYKGRPMDVANSIGKFYENAGATGDLPDFNTVYKNLVDPKKGGGVANMFNGVKAPKAMQKATGYQYEYGKEPLAAADAGTQFENLLGGALALLPKETAAGYASYASRLTDQAVLRDMKKKPGKGKDIPQMVGRKLFG